MILNDAQSQNALNASRNRFVRVRMTNYEQRGIAEINLKKLRPLIEELSRLEFPDKPLNSYEARTKGTLKRNIRIMLKKCKTDSKKHNKKYEVKTNVTKPYNDTDPNSANRAVSDKSTHTPSYTQRHSNTRKNARSYKQTSVLVIPRKH